MHPISSSPFVKNFFEEPLRKEHSLALRVSVVAFHFFTLCIPLIVYHLFIKPPTHPWDQHLPQALQAVKDVLESREPNTPLACQKALEEARKALMDVQPSDESPLDPDLKRCEQAFKTRYTDVQLKQDPKLVWPAICVAYWARLLVLNELPLAILRKNPFIESGAKRIRNYIAGTPDHRCYLGSKTLEFGIYLDHYQHYHRKLYERFDEITTLVSKGFTQEQEAALGELKKHSRDLRNKIVPDSLQESIAFNGSL